MSWKPPSSPQWLDQAMSKLIITTLRPKHFAALEALQRTVYPTLGSHELMRAEHFAAQYERFPQGQVVALLDNQVIGQGSGFFIDFDFAHPDHTFSEICDGFYFTHHDPNGAYYYGADISVHPNFRGRGIGRRIYDARKEVVRQANRRGIVGGGLIPGYAAHKANCSPQEYVEQVISGELRDSTLSFQLAMGFQVRGMIANYIEDSASDNWATLIEWVNPDYKPG
jgi:GNAT superfamily N-acetyltransferase